jgi:hypothetical protein
MTLIRIVALSVLLGAAVAGVVWFLWGAIANLLPRRAPAVSGDAKDAKDTKKEAGPGKAA